MMNRISLSSFAFLIILLSLRIELCYAQLDYFPFIALLVVSVSAPNCFFLICCFCCCYYFKYKKRSSRVLLFSSPTNPTNSLRSPTSANAPVPTIPRPTATPQNTVNNRTSNSSISSVDHPPRRTLSASRSVDNTHSTNLSPQRADSPTQIDISPPSVINTQLPIAPLVYPTVSPPSYEEATQYPVTLI